MSQTVAHLLQVKGRDVATVGASETIRNAIAVLGTRNIGAVVVVDEHGGVAGIFSERDIVHALGARGGGCLDDAVAAAMTTDVHTCEESTTTDELMSQMTQRRVRHVPVVKDGRLAGIVSIGDVVKSRVDELEVTNASLEEYITGSSY